MVEASSVRDFAYPGRFPSRRSNVHACNGMVATSQPLAAQAGLRVLQSGGNAVDAAIAAAFVLAVTEPRSTHLGGDAFALVRLPGGEVIGLNGSGASPKGLTRELVRRSGHATRMPQHGPLTITVPGQLQALFDLSTRYGRLPWTELVTPAAEYALEGVPVAEETAARWHEHSPKLRSYGDVASNPYLINGEAPRAGQVFRNHSFGKFLSVIAERGAEEFYAGPIGVELCAELARQGALLTWEDLKGHRSEWVVPLSTVYRGHDVYQLPPNNSGIVTLLALEALNSIDLRERSLAGRMHAMAECIKHGLTVGVPLVGDPRTASPDTDVRRGLRAPTKQFAGVDRHARRYRGLMPPGSDTVHVATADAEGMVVSLMTSTFDGFGSGIVDRNTGLIMQNRAANFSFDPESPNVVGPGKRPYHTIMPALACSDTAEYALGVVGSMMQPQGLVQLLSLLLDSQLTPQEALDAPRFRVLEDSSLQLEGGIDPAVGDELSGRGHSIHRSVPPARFGGGQVIRRCDAVLTGGSDGRKDGLVAAY